MGMRLKLVLLLFLEFAFVAFPREPHHQRNLNNAGVEQTLSVTVDRVNVLFTVAGRGGKLITNLTKNDFRVFEDGELQTISNFSRDADLPLNVALLIDISGSVRDKLRFEREAASRFFYSVLRSGRDKALLMTFDTKSEIVQDYTDNPAVLQTAMLTMVAGGSTSLYDAVAKAALHQKSSQNGRHVIIVLSDGLDNASHIDLANALQIAQENDAIIYTISTNRIEGAFSSEPELGDSHLTTLAAETGGRALFPTRMEQLPHAFDRIIEEIRAQYSLAYGPTNGSRDGSFRTIHVVPSHKGYVVRCRHGYFAPISTH
jgi:Ca-activated chloride channel family protein